MLKPPAGSVQPLPKTGKGRFLLALASRQKTVLFISALLYTVRGAAIALMPYLVGQALDGGAHNMQAVLIAGGLMTLLALIQAVTDGAVHVFEMAAWFNGAYPTIRALGHHTTQTGDALTGEISAGEVVTTAASDSEQIGSIFEVFGRTVGSVFAFALIGTIMLVESIKLGLLVLVGVPLLGFTVMFLVKPLERRIAVQRDVQGKLTTLGSDTVAGLRILRGIGGEAEFAARYRDRSQSLRAAGVKVARIRSWMEAMQALLPGIFVAVVVWVGAHMTINGEISAGTLIAFFGYTAYLSRPLRDVTSFMQFLTRARVGAAKVQQVLSVKAATSTPPTATLPTPLPALVDTKTGVRIEPGQVTAIVSSDPDFAAAIAHRLGRFDDAHSSGVQVGNISLTAAPLAQIRNRIVVSHATTSLFAGTLRSNLQVRECPERSLRRALEVADAHDVLDSLETIDGVVDEKGRNLSGGQRQRVALARALVTSPEVLILVDPTSAVDSHTESRIAHRLAHHRRGQTTVIVTASPLVLDVVDTVVHVEADGVHLVGTHQELLSRTDPAARAYVAIVRRGADDAAADR